MSTCSRCHQPHPAQAIQCPNCGLALKAFGHQGIQLHRAKAGQFLCATCVYDHDDSCTYPQRPYAQECTLYRDLTKPVRVSAAKSPVAPGAMRGMVDWCRRHGASLTLVGILLLAIWLTLKR
jgi:hypothetical protein